MLARDRRQPCWTLPEHSDRDIERSPSTSGVFDGLIIFNFDCSLWRSESFMQHELHFVNQFVSVLLQLWVSQLQEDSPLVLIRLVWWIGLLRVFNEFVLVPNSELDSKDFFVQHTSLSELSVHDIVLISVCLLQKLLELFVDCDFEFRAGNCSAQSTISFFDEWPLDALAAEVVVTWQLARLYHDFSADRANMVFMLQMLWEISMFGDSKLLLFYLRHVLRRLSLWFFMLRLNFRFDLWLLHLRCFRWFLVLLSQQVDIR